MACWVPLVLCVEKQPGCYLFSFDSLLRYENQFLLLQYVSTWMSQQLFFLTKSNSFFNCPVFISCSPERQKSLHACVCMCPSPCQHHVIWDIRMLSEGLTTGVLQKDVTEPSGRPKVQPGMRAEHSHFKMILFCMKHNSLCVFRIWPVVLIF